MFLNTNLMTCPFRTASISSMYFIPGVLLEFARVSSLHLAQAPPVTQEGACAKTNAALTAALLEQFSVL